MKKNLLQILLVACITGLIIIGCQDNTQAKTPPPPSGMVVVDILVMNNFTTLYKVKDKANNQTIYMVTSGSSSAGLTTW